tara:strand:+ start:249 stop:485 length:237 start_codon:yes stop_codon:yes gene_type:complete
MSACKKCLRGPLSVHVLSSGFCQECQSELEWKNAPRIIKEQREKAARVAYYKKAEKYIEKKWKDKYGDDTAEQVLEYK